MATEALDLIPLSVLRHGADWSRQCMLIHVAMFGNGIADFSDALPRVHDRIPGMFERTERIGRKHRG